MTTNFLNMIRLGIEYDALHAFQKAAADDATDPKGDFEEKVIGILDYHFEKFLHMTVTDQTDEARAQRLALLTTLEDGASRVSTSIWVRDKVKDEIGKRRMLWKVHIQSS